MRFIGLNAFLWFALSACVYGETISLWNFNDATPGITGGEQEFLVDYGSGIMTSDFALSNIGNLIGSTVNNPNDDPAGRALRLNGYANNGNSLTWMTSTAGFDSIEISFAVQGTGTGFNNNQFQYTADSGNSWISFGDPFMPDTDFTAQIFDLSGILELINNSNAGFRIVFDGATSASGNNRIDNLMVSGNPMDLSDSTQVPESSTIILVSIGAVCACLSRLKFA